MSASAAARHSPGVIAMARKLWSSGVTPDLIADALTAEFGKAFSGPMVQGLAYRNEFSRSPEAARSGRQDNGTLLEGMEIRIASAAYLAALRAGSPKFNSVEAKQ